MVARCKQASVLATLVITAGLVLSSSTTMLAAADQVNLNVALVCELTLIKLYIQS